MVPDRNAGFRINGARAAHGVCVLCSLGLASRQGPEVACERTSVCLVETAGTLDLRTPAAGDAVLPLAHPGARHGCPCEKAAGGPAEGDARGARLAACVLAVDAQGRVLLTRRQRSMRSFPGAWVLPGGGVDAGERAVDAAVRELEEETGIVANPASLKPLCVWESCYPPTRAFLAQGGEVKSHYAIVFYRALVGNVKTLSLQEEEADAAVWLTPAQLQGQGQGDGAAVPLAAGEGGPVPLADVRSVYPAAPAETEAGVMGMTGTGAGHLWALERYALGLTDRNPERPNIHGQVDLEHMTDFDRAQAEQHVKKVDDRMRAAAAAQAAATAAEGFEAAVRGVLSGAVDDDALEYLVGILAECPTRDESAEMVEGFLEAAEGVESPSKLADRLFEAIETAAAVWNK